MSVSRSWSIGLSDSPVTYFAGGHVGDWIEIDGRAVAGWPSPMAFEKIVEKIQGAKNLILLDDEALGSILVASCLQWDGRLRRESAIRRYAYYMGDTAPRFVRKKRLHDDILVELTWIVQLTASP